MLPITAELAPFLTAICLAGVALASAGQAAEQAASEQSPRELHGADVGGDAMLVYVIRDKATWESLKKEQGPPHVFPKGTRSGSGLGVLDGVDFQKDMIVAVFWGRMNFAGHGEDCQISGVKRGQEEITVDCRAKLWGGQILRSYEAWPYAARVIAKSDLPVMFVQTIDYKAKPDRSVQSEKLATLKPSDWKQAIKEKPENAL